MEVMQKIFTNLKFELISRFYPLSKENIIENMSVLDFGHNYFMRNENIYWDDELFKLLEGKIDWSSLWVIKNLKVDFNFFQKYEAKIDFGKIEKHSNIEWSDEILSLYACRFDWSKSLITKKPLSTTENLRKYADKLDWCYISQWLNIEFTEEILEEFSDKWDWQKLSANKNLPLSVEFIQKHIERLDFDVLSQNPKAIDIIYKYPTSKKWNWDRVILNPAIIFTKESFDFVFNHYKRQYETKEFTNPIMIKMPLPSFLFKVFSFHQNDISYFFHDEFINDLPWKNLPVNRCEKIPLEFVEKYKEKLNFKESYFLRNHKDVITRKFVKENLDLFDPTNHSFYYLPLSIEILNELKEKVNWDSLSSCVNLDWNIEFIKKNIDKLNPKKLSQNIGVYNCLIDHKII